MTGLGVLLAGLALTGVYAWVRVWQRRVREHGFLVISWRLLTGLTWHGGLVSDRGWFRPGTRALTATGHIGRAHHQPRWKVTARRLGSFTGLVCAAYGWFDDRPATENALAAAGAAGLAWLGFRGLMRLRIRKHRKSWLAPLHAAIHHHLDRPITDRPESYIHVELDRSSGYLELPAGVTGSDRFKKQLETDIAARLGLEAPVFDWRGIAGPKPVVKWEQPQPPPALVPLAMIREAIDDAKTGQIVLGLGVRAQVVSVSVAGESPHVLINGPTSSGKSVAVMSFIAQFLYHGGFAIILDFKELSQVWADSLDGTLPNIVYCRSDEEIHTMVLWLRGEMRRRNKVARHSARRDGRIEANVGDRLLIAVEEMNVTAARLARYWAQARDPGDPVRSPAVEAMNELLFMGRQTKCHILMASQRAEANAVGGGAARENLVARILLGKIQKKTWAMLAGEFEYPATMTTGQGHAHVITGTVRECQTVLMPPQEAWDLSLAGEVALAPHDMPYVVKQQAPQIESSQAEGDASGAVAPPAEPLIGLREAIETGPLQGRSLAAVRTWRNRHRDRFPVPAGYNGSEELYLESDLEMWDEMTRRTVP